jgi:hypothetical protein
VLAELCDAEELAAEKPPERPPLLPPLELPPARPKDATPERGADGGATERDAVEKLRAGAAVGRAPGLATRIAEADVGTATRAPFDDAVIAPARALVAAGASELTKRCDDASKARDEPPPRPTLRAAFPPAMVRSMRAGAVVFATRAFTVFVGIDFTVLNSAPL